MTAPLERPPAPEECEAIRQVIYGYCRGIDRCDREALERCYWPEAIDDHATYVGPAAEFIGFALAAVRPMVTQHMIGNVLIESAGDDAARVESYFQAIHRLPAQDGAPPMEWVLYGRYLDRFERRDGEWRILHRMLAIEHERRMPVTAPDPSFIPRPEAVGGKKPDDPLYRFLLNG